MCAWRGVVGVGFSTMESLLSPLERSTKEYLVSSVGKELVELLTELAVARPADPHLWLAERLLAKSPAAKSFEIVERVVKDR